MKRVSLRKRIDMAGGQPPSPLRVDPPGVFTAKKDRGARFQTPPHKKAKLSHLARTSALRPVPHSYRQSILVNIWLSNLAINTLAEGIFLFWSKPTHVVA